MIRRRTHQLQPVQRHNAVVFSLGGRRFSVPAGQVVEIARISSYTTIPCEDPANLGVVVHRDRLIPLMDLGRRLGVARVGDVQLPALCLLVKTDLGELGLLLDQVMGFESSGDKGPTNDVTCLDLNRLGDLHVKSAAG